MSYEDRMPMLGLAPKHELKDVLEGPSPVTLLDVRSAAEIAASGRFEYAEHRWVQVACSPTSATDLMNSSESLLPNKEAPIIVYCASGRRASTAKKALEDAGYKKVLNAGGYNDVNTLRL